MNGNDQASDYDVLRAVSDSLSRVPMARPPQPEAVMARGRARQRRRRGYGMTVALAAAAAAAAAVTVTVLPAGSHPAGSHPAGPVASAPASARLAAWTVTRRADGDINVTISELSDPAGLQSTLRADGVPVSVTFLSQPNPACSPLGFGPGLLGKIFPGSPSGAVHHLNGGTALGTGGKVGGDMVIDPSTIPGGAGLQLAFSRMDGSAPGHFTILGRMALVRASQQCTGS
jgi:hypothetical protein